MQPNLQNMMYDLNMLKSDIDIMLKRTNNIANHKGAIDVMKFDIKLLLERMKECESSINKFNNIEERLELKIDDIARGVVQKKKKLQDEINEIWDRCNTCDENYDKITNRYELLRDLFLHVGDNMMLPSQSVDVVVRQINEFRVFDENDNDDNDYKIVKDKFATKHVHTCGQYLQLCLLTEKLEDSLEYGCVKDKKNAIKKLSAYIDTLPNKEESLTQTSQEDQCDTVLSHANLIQEATNFYKSNSLTNEDLTKTIQEMLRTKQYMLSPTFQKTKLNFDEANVTFLSAVAPYNLSQDELHRLLFV